MFRFWGSIGLGAYVGLATGGILGLVSGEVFTAGSRWVAALPVLMLVGTVIGLAAARLSSRWLLPRLSRRASAFLVVGVLSCPLVAAVGSTTPIEVPLVFMVAGSVTTATVWRRHRRLVAARPASGYSRTPEAF